MFISSSSCHRNVKFKSCVIAFTVICSINTYSFSQLEVFSLGVLSESEMIIYNVAVCFSIWKKDSNLDQPS